MAEAWLDPNLDVEARLDHLLAAMTLEEKIGQLKARSFFGKLFEMFSIEGLPEALQHKLMRLMFRMVFRERELMSYLMAHTFKTTWKQTVVEGEGEKYAVGQLSAALRPFAAKEGAELANMMQDYVQEHARLPIPLIIHDECIHGCMAKGSTIFPQSIGMASTWDPDLLEEVAVAIGKETRARGIHQCLSPTINIARDPRCGRTEETYGEDPYLTTLMAVAFVRGVQSQRVVTTPKHFVANFVGDGGRDSYPIHLSERILREVYLPAFKAVLEGDQNPDGPHALSVMPAYNSIDGLPCSCDPWLLTELLREAWGFEGYAGSDYMAVEHIYSKHGTARDEAEAAKRAIEAGMDVEWPESRCFEKLLDLVNDGELDEAMIDQAARRVLRVKFWLGLFDDVKVDPDYAEAVCDCEEHRELALKAARASIVLLKNEDVLPLGERVASIAVIGPSAATERLGGYAGHGVKVVTPWDGIQEKVRERGQSATLVEGCALSEEEDPPAQGIAAAVKAADKADVAILFVGNAVPQTEGEQRDRADLDLPGEQEALIQQVCETGTPIVVVLLNGSAVTMANWIDKVQAVVEAWYPGEEGGHAIADVLFGDYNPGGKLPLTFPQTTGQLPLYYNHKPTGRADDYVDLRGKQPQFPFGHGLSYTTFAYHNLEIAPDELSAGDEVHVSLEVENTGAYAGEEIVQLYLRKPVSEVVRPVMALKGFQKIALDAGEKKTVTLGLTAEDLTFLNAAMELVVEPGVYEVMVGRSAEDIRLKGNFEIQ